MKKRFLSMLLAVATILSLFVVPASAVNLPSISSSKYISCYTLNTSGKVYAYTKSDLKTKTGGYINCSTDECRIIKYEGDAVQVSYPVSSGRKIAWFDHEVFTKRDWGERGPQAVATAKTKLTTYKRMSCSNSVVYGYISSGDKIYINKMYDDVTQAIYPVGSTYKMAWVKTADLKKSIVSGITLSSGNFTLSSKGATKTLTTTIAPSLAADAISWKSSNTSVATVSSSGKVTAVANGTATITATSSNGTKATVKVTVNIPVPATKVTLNTSSFTLTSKGASKTLSAILTPSNSANKVTWKSSNTGVATVSSSGKVTAVANGTATITATASNGAKATAKVTVELYSKNEALVKARLDKIANGTLKYDSKTVLKVGKKFVGTRSNEECKGYARNVFILCFGKNVGSTKEKPNNHLLKNIGGVRLVDSVTKMTQSSIKALFMKARPGDFVQMRRTHGGSHSAIVYSVSSTGVTFLEANTDGKNTITKTTHTWAALCTKNQKMSVYTAENYKLK